MEKKSKKQKLIALEKVIGTTTLHNNAITSNEKSGDVAYLAGAVIVVYNPRKNKQRRFFRAKSSDPVTALSCVQFSHDGEWIAAGERGQRPTIHVFNVNKRKRIITLKGEHELSISCIRFSPNGKYLVSIGGFKKKQTLIVWSLKEEEGKVVAKSTLEYQVSSLSFDETGRYFVTAGSRGNVSFWYFDAQGNVTKNEMIGLLGACTSRFQNSDFVDVVCGRGTCRADTYVDCVCVCFPTY